MAGMASRERLAAAGLGRALTTEAVSQVAADVGVCVRPVLRRVTDRQTGAVEQVHRLPLDARIAISRPSAGVGPTGDAIVREEEPVEQVTPGEARRPGHERNVPRGAHVRVLPYCCS